MVSDLPLTKAPESVIPGELAIVFTSRDGSDVGPVDLGFIARTVRVDNPTNQWYFIPAAQQWVPPYTMNMVCQLVLKTQIAGVRNMAPAGITQAAPISGQTATFIWTERVYLPSAGFVQAVRTSPDLPVRTDTSNTISPGADVIDTLSREFVFDGNLWYRKRGVVYTNLLPSGTRTTTQILPDRTNYSYAGAVILLNISNVGTGSLSVSIQGKQEADNVYFSMFQSNAQTSNGLKVLGVIPGAYTPIVGTPTTQITEAYNGVLITRTYRVVITHNNANPVTYSVDLIEIPWS
ncbi:MAG: hypothetical protein QXI19_06295 [Candidatus Caldarchaeum sp.]